MRLEDYITEAEESDKKRWLKYVRNNGMLKAGVAVMNTITKKGFTAYIVGGSVRDVVMGQEPHDVDIATNMPIEELEKIFKVHDLGMSRDFGIVVVNQGGHSFEIAQFRQDGKYTDGRRPDNVKICQSFEGDASRRDFCFNAMGIDAEGNIIDYFDGRKDIKNKGLKTVGNPAERFKEDHIRMLRAVRFSSKMGFDIESDTKDAITRNVERLKNISPERIQQELLKMASQSGDKFADAVVMLDDTGILRQIMPDLVKLKDSKQNPFWHPEGNPWEHTLEALRQNKVADPIVNLSILLHDIGKSQPSSYEAEKGYHRFFGHAKIGVDLVTDLAKKLKLSNKDRERILFAVANHMKVHEFPSMKPSKIVKLMHDENWATLYAVAKADSLSARQTKTWGEIVQKIEQVEKKWGSETAGKVVKAVDGKRVMQLTGLKPSKEVGIIMKKVTDDVINNNVKNQKDIDALILKHMKG